MHENHLIHEKSPYLLQHAHNPVDWYPWGVEAFDRAQREHLPIFLSIGYSTCHWCHVMERESFEDEEVAGLLNRHFVSIKVDREERPDIDAIYMAVCQSLTGSGGWPLTIVMTPDQKPFFAGTYLPKHARYGSPGLMELLRNIAHLWRGNPEQLLQAGDEIAAQLQEQAARHSAPTEPSLSLADRAVRQLRNRFDPKYGGFGEAPKFPTPHNLLFLLEYAVRTGDHEARSMAEETLAHLYRGGIFDHVGGGCSRYATDHRWLIPHFEKMLYDNALLAYTALEAYQISNQMLYRAMAERTLRYMLRELANPDGGFYCGQDADSGGEEGAYYVLTPQEIEHVLGSEDSAAFCAFYGITKNGHFEGKSIPNLLGHPLFTEPPASFAPLCKALYRYRRSRVKLHCDDKILTSWNALAIAAFAKAAAVLGNDVYLEAAQQARRFLQSHLRTPNGRLMVRWRDGEAAHAGQLDDYAFYTWALLELYRASFDLSCLSEAIETAEIMVQLFFDCEQGGFYLYASDAEQLIARPKELYDGALPSGNSMAALALVRLAALTGEPAWQERAELQLRFLSGNIADYPAAHCFALLALEEALHPPKDLICTLSGAMPPNLRHVLQGLPLNALIKTAENADALTKIAPFTSNYPIPASGEAYYLCQNGACAAPVDNLEALRDLL